MKDDHSNYLMQQLKMIFEVFHGAHILMRTMEIKVLEPVPTDQVKGG